MKNEEYISKWLAGTLTPEELASFEKTSEYQDLLKLSRALQSFKAPDFDTRGSYAQLHDRKHKAAKVVPFAAWVKPLIRVAAVLLLAAAVYAVFLKPSNAPTSISTMAAEKQDIWLPDSSSMTLFPLSELSFASHDWQKQRSVKLHGEAFFRVRKGSHFDVTTSSGTIRVLGTQFMVKNRDGFFEVICYEGSVAVETDKERTVLRPQELFRMVDGIVVEQQTAVASIPVWTDDESWFHSVPFRYVVAELERQYNISVRMENIDQQRLFSGAFTHHDLDLALRSISIPFHIDYTITDDKTVVLIGANN